MNLSILAIEVGNSRTRLGCFEGRELREVTAVANGDLAAIADAAATRWESLAAAEERAVVVASVNDPVADRLAIAIEDRLGGVECHRIGRDLPVPIGESLDPETITGVDRLLAAAAAWDTLRQACVVIDAGTAVTVDFVDGAGTFHGGAIAPGARMQLEALHARTAQLPAIELARPAEGEAFGRNTREAMLHGIVDGIRGLVWRLVERYAEAYGAFPMVVATGGDAELLFGDDELVNRIVPDLTLRGIAAAARAALADGEDEPELRPFGDVGA
jgi:type III pantothenate kinase